MDSKIIVSGCHLSEKSLHDLHDMLEKLYRRSDRIVRIRLDLRRSHEIPPAYTARAVVEMRGPDLVATQISENLYKSVRLVTEKLGRMLSDRTHRHEDFRRHPHAVDIPVLLPKADW
jgi:putative sigma-54 modulation protein